MEESQKISILMEEYNTLRAEVMAARSYVAQAIGISAAVMIGIIGFTSSPNFSGSQWLQWVLAALTFTYLVGTLIWNDINTRKFTKRLREIESNVNARAGERLLIWETESGWGSIVARNKRKNK